MPPRLANRDGIIFDFRLSGEIFTGVPVRPRALVADPGVTRAVSPASGGDRVPWVSEFAQPSNVNATCDRVAIATLHFNIGA